MRVTNNTILISDIWLGEDDNKWTVNILCTGIRKAIPGIIYRDLDGNTYEIEAN